MNIEIENVDYHRNGVSGEGFYIIHFMWVEDEYVRNMMGVVFQPEEALDKDGYWLPAEKIPFHNPRVAVFDKDLLPSTRFMHNSWRGDHFADVLYEACRKSDAEITSTPGAPGNDEPDERHNYGA